MRKTRFEPTYKEWKPRLKFSLGERAGRFEPTYKEWKLGRLKGQAPKGLRFEPTYKEWKQTLRASSAGKTRLF